MNKKPRILFYCTFYHRALIFRQQMDALEKRGFYIRAFSTAQRGDSVKSKFAHIMDDKVKHFECWNKVEGALFFPRQAKLKALLLKAYNLNDFDLIHAHMLFNGGYIALQLKREYGIPYVVTVRATDLMGYTNIKLPYFNKLAVEILDNANGVLYLSANHKRVLEERILNEEQKRRFDAKSRIIGNCLEQYWTENKAEPRTKPLDPKGKIRILTVAKIRPVKNVTMAARAVEELIGRGYQASLTVIGENQNNRELKKIVAHDCVNYLGFMGKEELRDAYAVHDIMLLPSKNETFGRVYAEAMSQGLPVLYTANEGFDKNFPEGMVGHSIPADDPAVIADMIEDVVANYTQMSRNCVEMSAEFDEDVIIDKLESFYVDFAS